MKYLIIIMGLLFNYTVLAKDFSVCEDAGEFAELNASLCTTVKAPLNYLDSHSDKIDLFVRKFPATQAKKGSVWLVAGGPGESGASFYANIATFKKAFAGFDIFVPDHRGTGLSSSICPGENTTSLEGKNLVGEEWGECFSFMYSHLDYVKAFNITNAAKDLRFLINSLDDKSNLVVYGVSYGTQLVLRAAQLDNSDFDAIVLDSLVPMQDDEDYELSKRSNVVNMVGNTLLSKCDSQERCQGESATQLKQKLSGLLSKSRSLDQFSDSLGNSSLSDLLGTMLDIPQFRNQIPLLIHSLSKGDISVLESTLGQITTYYAQFNPGYINFGSSIPLVQIITASENNLRPELNKEDIMQEEQALLFTSPLPKLMAGNSMPTYEKDGFFAKLPNNLPRTLILQGTLDPKTHYLGAKKHAQQLTGKGPVHFIDIIDGPHFIGLNAPTCFVENVRRFALEEEKLDSRCKDPKALVSL